jgi:hypothetical protein
MERTDSNQTATGASAVLTAGGALTMALFPLALPMLLLTIVFVLPLLLPLLAAIPLVLAALAVRSVARRLRARDQLHPRTPSGRERDVPKADALRVRVGRT